MTSLTRNYVYCHSPSPSDRGRGFTPASSAGRAANALLVAWQSPPLIRDRPAPARRLLRGKERNTPLAMTSFWLSFSRSVRPSVSPALVAGDRVYSSVFCWGFTPASSAGRAASALLAAWQSPPSLGDHPAPARRLLQGKEQRAPLAITITNCRVPCMVLS